MSGIFYFILKNKFRILSLGLKILSFSSFLLNDNTNCSEDMI